MESSARVSLTLPKQLVPSSVAPRTGEALAPADADPGAPAAPLVAVRLAHPPSLPRTAARRLPEAACIPLRARHCMTMANCFAGVVGLLGGAFVGLLVDLAAEMNGMDVAQSAPLGASFGTGTGLLLGMGMYWCLQNRDREQVAPAADTPEPAQAPAPTDASASPHAAGAGQLSGTAPTAERLIHLSVDPSGVPSPPPGH